MTQYSNQKSKAPKGKPSGGERGGNGLKDVNLNEAKDQIIEEKYLELSVRALHSAFNLEQAA